MLSDQEKQEIEAELAHYERPQALCIEALKIVQKHRGWVSDEAIRDVGEAVGLSPHEVDSVATFYNLIYRREVGRHVIHYCDSVSCWVMGCDKIRNQLCQELKIQPGQTTEDQRFTLLPIPCLGACDTAPAVMIDEDLHGNLNSENLKDILARYD
ncbi:MAG: NADH-quinone oxidoreductase subunit NuoE [Opitutales bacterium]|nr:NADH-quinone oxidoreductase subunit NuoE [Opitutales bacterium]